LTENVGTKVIFARIMGLCILIFDSLTIQYTFYYFERILAILMDTNPYILDQVKALYITYLLYNFLFIIAILVSSAGKVKKRIKIIVILNSIALLIYTIFVARVFFLSYGFQSYLNYGDIATEVSISPIFINEVLYILSYISIRGSIQKEERKLKTVKPHIKEEIPSTIKLVERQSKISMVESRTLWIKPIKRSFYSSKFAQLEESKKSIIKILLSTSRFEHAYAYLIDWFPKLKASIEIFDYIPANYHDLFLEWYSKEMLLRDRPDLVFCALAALNKFEEFIPLVNVYRIICEYKGNSEKFKKFLDWFRSLAQIYEIPDKIKDKILNTPLIKK